MTKSDITDNFKNADDITLEKPIPLIPKNNRPAPYPYHLLGSELIAAIEAIQASTRASIEICVQSVLSAISLAVQSHANIQLRESTSPVSLFFMTIAESGARKSSADKLAMRAIVEHQQKLVETYKTQLANYRKQEIIYNCKRRAMDNDAGLTAEQFEKQFKTLGEPPKPPLYPIMICQEPTFEGLLKILNDGQPSMGIYSDEGGQFLGGFGMSKDKLLNTITGLCKLWDGDSVSRVRSGDKSIIISGKRLCLHLMMQPYVFETLTNNKLVTAQGLFSRICCSAPYVEKGNRLSTNQEPVNSKAITKLNHRLTEILSTKPSLRKNTRNELEPKTLSIAIDALSSFSEWSDKVERESGKYGKFEFSNSLVNKMPEIAVRIAAVLTLYENINATEISLEKMNAGIGLAKFYADEATRIFSIPCTDSKLKDAQRLLDWILEKWANRKVSFADMLQNGPNPFRKKNILNPLVEILVEHNWLHLEEGTHIIKGQNRRIVYSINVAI